MVVVVVCGDGRKKRSDEHCSPHMIALTIFGLILSTSVDLNCEVGVRGLLEPVPTTFTFTVSGERNILSFLPGIEPAFCSLSPDLTMNSCHAVFCFVLSSSMFLALICDFMAFIFLLFVR